MNIQTKYFGEQEINEEDIYSFPNGIPGFLDEKQFILEPFGDAFFILQSVKSSHVAFIVTSPFFFFEDYEFKIPDNVIEKFHIKDSKDITVLVTVHVQEPFSKSTANLQAPLILNEANHKAKQLILDSKIYQTKHLLNPQHVKGVK
ncbi:flagellar assembly protein FliW [Terrilactibacillus laevilacticus]|uniref:flagellar assembly protein FliW n=1 Tax=Terrilactibacillus laevilacticus TaxID=1380157 RepID=UPI00114650B3|nr:flagellar assembly protein FliW [Terrilactibacillus laevilacticus]